MKTRPAQTRVVALTADFMSRFFNLPVRVRETAPPDRVPRAALRPSPVGSGRQVKAGYVMAEVLRPTLPPDACPECTAKLCWAAGADPRERYARLADFCARHGLTEEGRFFETSRRALERQR